MRIEIIPVYKNLLEHMNEANCMNADSFWQRYAIEPFWDKLCCYAPFDLSERKPSSFKSMDSLREQLTLLDTLDIDALQAEFTRIAESLPGFDDDPISVALFPLDPDNKTVFEKQNGVIGGALFGNIMIQINPLAENFAEWIPYVFAHEYHHTIWGSYWYVMHGGELTQNLLTSLVIDGEADSFALSHYPAFRPKWLFSIDEDELSALYSRVYQPILGSSDFDYSSLMFGNASLGIPWCAGYAVGYRIVQRYISARHMSISELLKINPAEIIS